MRLIFLTDIHDDFEAIGEILEKVKADLYLLGGDILYRIFRDSRAAWKFLDLEEQLARQRKWHDEQLLETAVRLMKTCRGEELSRKARAYIRLCHTVERRMIAAYGRLARILESFPHRTVRVIPGNYDMDLRKTPLHPWNLHLDWIEVEGIRIAGYGGASVVTRGVPEHLQVPFRERLHLGSLESEVLEFLRRVRPHIVLTHQPPHGVMDTIRGKGPTGSLGARQYLDEAQPLAILFGHVHEKWGVTRVGRTWCINPSNFGAVVEVKGRREGGYFVDMGLGENGVDWAMIRRLKRGRTIDVVHYGQGDRGMEMTVLDEKAFSVMGGKVKAPRPRGPFRILQRIKAFFLLHETQKSRELVTELRRCYRALEREGLNIAFDILGSVAFGMATKGSDMDLVVYLKALGCVEDDRGVCAIPSQVLEKLLALEQKGIKVEICDVLDLGRVVRAIGEENLEDPHLQRFVFYRAVGRPVNLRILKGVENRLLERDHLRRRIERLLEEYVRVLTSSSRHMDSFQKYTSRIGEMGVDVPPKIQMAIKAYLSG
jgi:Icc-related predicted phosphoesterase